VGRRELDVVASPRRFDVYLVGLDPTQGSEMQKTRPCVVISPDELNRALQTVIIAPLTSARRDYPSRVPVTFQRKKGQVVLDQIRSVDKGRMLRRLGRLPESRAREISNVLTEMFAYR